MVRGLRKGLLEKEGGGGNTWKVLGWERATVETQVGYGARELATKPWKKDICDGLEKQ